MAERSDQEGRPGAERPDAERPGAERPDAERSGAERPDAERSGEQPQEVSGDAEWERVLDDPGAPLYTVGVVAELVGVDPQVVRGYDRSGLVEPDRVGSGHRRYSRRDIARLAHALDLAEEGITRAGIERILALEDRLAVTTEDGDADPGAVT